MNILLCLLIPAFCLITCFSVIAQDEGQSNNCADNVSLANCHFRRVSIINLVATPERYYDKHIEVAGHLALAFENTGLSRGLHGFAFNEVIEVDIDHGNFPDNATAERHQKRFKLWNCKFHGNWVLLKGIFRSVPYVNDNPFPSSGKIEIINIVVAPGGKERSCKHLDRSRPNAGAPTE
ncbi:MAG: hypothetical protein ABL878_00595 [Burkholderiales bacterium]